MKSYFKFSRKEKIGVISLAVLIFLMLGLLYVDSNSLLADSSDVRWGKMEISTFSEKSLTDEQDRGTEGLGNLEPNEKNDTLFNFDPNTIQVHKWKMLGFSEKQSQSIIKYRDSYGPFQRKEDVGKIYVISDEKYAEIAPFMVFDTTEGSNEIEMNSATLGALESIHGIGPIFAERTIEFRNLLGGYYTTSQFSEIYGITPEAEAALRENVSVNPATIKKIRVNSALKADIKAHPYLNDWSVIAEIVQQRDRMELINLDFLIEKKLLSQEELSHVLPYISFE